MKLIGNSSHVVNWPDLLIKLTLVPGRSRGSNQQDNIHHNLKVSELRTQWEEAGYEDNQAVGWIDYDVPQDVVDSISDWLDVTPIGAWITCVPPGYCVPWHYDITDDEEQILAGGEPLRFTCHISTPSFGQVFVLEDHAFYNETQGNFYQWNNWQQWHGGMNMGLNAKFLFNFMAYKK